MLNSSLHDLTAIQREARLLEQFGRSQAAFVSATSILWATAGLVLARELARRQDALSSHDSLSIWPRVRHFLESPNGAFTSAIWDSLFVDARFPYSQTALDVLLSDYWRVDAAGREWLLRWIEKFDWDPREETAPAGISPLLDELLASHARRPDVAQFVTPAPVAQLMVDLGAPQAGETIYDPCFGSGSLLLGCSEALRQRFELSDHILWGSELNSQIFALGLTRLSLVGIPFRAECGDTLQHPNTQKLFGASCDLILANLPFGGRVESSRYRHLFPVVTSDVALLFLQHIMNSLRPGGRAIVCLAEGALFRSGTGEQVRARLLREFNVESVVSLPPGTFEPYTGIKASLLSFQRATPSGSVRFMESPPLRGSAGRLGRDPEALAPAEVASQLRKGRSDRVWTVPTGHILERNADLSAKRPAAPQSEEFSGFATVRLEEIAEIWRGIPYRSASLTDAPTSRRHKDFVGLIRISELQEGRFAQVRAPQVFTTAESVAKHRDRFLVEGDILVAGVGAKVKVGIVGPEAAGASASHNLIVVRPNKRITSDYLIAMLRSRLFEQWFKAHAVGSTVQRIAPRDLWDFTVPLPAIDVQREVAYRFETTQQDAALLLRNWHRSENKGTLWPALQALAEKTSLAKFQASDSDRAARFLATWSRDFLPIRNRAFHASVEINDSLDLVWVTALDAATQIWSDLEHVPLGPTRLWLLERANTHLSAAKLRLEEQQLSDVEAKRRLVELLWKINNAASNILFETVKVEFEIEPKEIEAAKSNEVFLRVQNASILPLRNFEVLAAHLNWRVELPFIGDGCQHRFALTLVPNEGEGPMEFQTQWKAVCLNGDRVEGKASIGVTVISTQRQELDSDLGFNPYITGKPIPGERKEIVFGREEIRIEVENQLLQADSANVFFFIGNRRAGKTTLLEQLRRQPPGGWIFAFTSFQKAEGENKEGLISNKEAFRLWALAIVEELFREGIELWPPLSDFIEPLTTKDKRLERKKMVREALNAAFAQTAQPFDLLEEYLRAALNAIAPRRLLLMVDEFDKLAQSISANTATQSVPENLRYLLQTYSNFTAIIAGSHRLRELSGGYWAALFGLGIEKNIGCLSKEACQSLVTQPVAGRIQFTEEARDEIVHLCARHAYLIQGFCSHIFNCVERTGNRLVTGQVVADVAEEMVSHHPFFDGLWLDAETERRRLLMVICAHFESGPEAVTQEFLLDQLEANGVNVPRKKEVVEDLRFLRELGVLKLHSGLYAVAIPLLTRWLKSQRDLSGQSELAREEAESLT